MGAVNVGVDIGQKVDPSAIVVVETVVPASGNRREQTHQVRFIETLPLGTPYPGVARRVAQVVTRLQSLTPNVAPMLLIDATGVGRPGVDLLVDALRGRRCLLRAATFTHGDRAELVDGELRIGKAYLVSLLQSLLQTNRVKLPRTGEAEALARELLDFEIRVDGDANDKYGAFKVGAHDDLVTALGLACWLGEQPVPRFQMVDVRLGSAPPAGNGGQHGSSPVAERVRRLNEARQNALRWQQGERRAAGEAPGVRGYMGGSG